MSDASHRKQLSRPQMAILFITVAFILGWFFYDLQDSRVQDSFGPFTMAFIFALAAFFICCGIHWAIVFINWVKRRNQRRQAQKEYAVQKRRQAEAEADARANQSKPS